MRLWLKKLRNNKQLSQQELATALDISQNYYSNIENGERQKQLSLPLVVRIAEIFGVSVEWIADQERQLSKDGGIK